MCVCWVCVSVSVRERLSDEVFDTVCCSLMIVVSNSSPAGEVRRSAIAHTSCLPLRTVTVAVSIHSILIPFKSKMTGILCLLSTYVLRTQCDVCSTFEIERQQF